MNDVSRLDLSQLPPEIRGKLEQQMARMSPEMRAHFMGNGLPQLLQRLGAGAGNATAGARAAAANVPVDDLKRLGQQLLARGRRAPRGHFNETIRPGDAPGSGRWLVVAVFVAAIGALLFR
ncbi:hypothetical protein [Arenimonas composti]|uniref:Uncharacterized protein n=1 Tax=Arenimonas composti TR7-09 = DSM 18010 TaxID=1121013 RepID=A0A091BJ03_9GAMM|nr:hypothetical protein [Arenimonas composti]KFN50769.1 hypothetical protein P873_05105 [Arenimonas composti TR7-09 = DSM 18010]